MITRFAEANGVTPVRQGVGRCCWAQGGKCVIYEVRPMICRVFGHGDHPDLTCPHGKNKNIKPKKLAAMISRHRDRFGQDERWVLEAVYTVEELEEYLPIEGEMP